MITFAYPTLFWVLLVPFLLFAFLSTTNKAHIERLFEPKVLERLRASKESMPLMFRQLTLFFAIFLMMVALARPVVEKGEKSVEVEGLTLLSALDISGSMRSRDLYPNRLTFAKKKMQQLFNALPSDKIGVMAFAYAPFMVAPFTSDKATLKQLLSGVTESYISMESTNFEALVEEANRLLEGKKPKILVLFSDGGDKEAIGKMKERLEAYGIDLYVVLVGTKKGAPVLDDKGKPLMLKEGKIAMTQRNDSLGEIAQSLGGASVVAHQGKEDMEKLASFIQSRYQRTHQGMVKIKERVELFYYPLALGLLLLLIALSSLPTLKKKEGGGE